MHFSTKLLNVNFSLSPTSLWGGNKLTIGKVDQMAASQVGPWMDFASFVLSDCCTQNSGTARYKQDGGVRT